MYWLISMTLCTLHGQSYIYFNLYFISYDFISSSLSQAQEYILTTEIQDYYLLTTYNLIYSCHHSNNAFFSFSPYFVHVRHTWNIKSRRYPFPRTTSVVNHQICTIQVLQKLNYCFLSKQCAFYSPDSK